MERTPVEVDEARLDRLFGASSELAQDPRESEKSKSRAVGMAANVSQVFRGAVRRSVDNCYDTVPIDAPEVTNHDDEGYPHS